MTPQSVTVCICTHNPRADILSRVLAALAAQTAGVYAFDVLLVDNASAPPLLADVLAALTGAGVRVRLVREPALGLVHARHRAARETQADWLLFVNTAMRSNTVGHLQRISTASCIPRSCSGLEQASRWANDRAKRSRGRCSIRPVGIMNFRCSGPCRNHPSAVCSRWSDVDGRNCLRENQLNALSGPCHPGQAAFDMVALRVALAP